MNKTEAAKLLGRLGGKARAKNLSAEHLSQIGRLGVTNRNRKLSAAERKKIAKRAARARWGEEKG
jgi:hypothetical protein